MCILALLSFCSFLAIALAQHVFVQVEDIVNDVIQPNDGLFSNIVEQFGIVSFSPTPSATTSETPTTSPSASVHPSVSTSSSPLPLSSVRPSLAPSPSSFSSASPSSSESPMPSSEGRRPSSSDAPEPSASSAAALVTPSASASSSPAPSASSSTTPSPSPSCTRLVAVVGGNNGAGGSAFSQRNEVAFAGTLTGIAVRAGGTGFRFETTEGVLRAGETDSNDIFLAVPPGETVQTAVTCKATNQNYVRFELSNGQFIESGTQPASGCSTSNAPPGGEILGSEGLVLPDGTIRAILLLGRTITC